MFKKVGISVLVVFILSLIIGSVILSGCGKVDSTTSPIKAPEVADQKQEDVNQALERLLPPSATYLTAKRDEQKQSIVTEDVNQDGLQETFVLYQDTKDNQEAKLLALQEVDGSWQQITDISTGFSSFDYFKLMDFNGDGKKELILGGGTSDTEAQKELMIYELNGNSLEEKTRKTYEQMEAFSLDERSTPYLFILDGDLNSLQSAELFSYMEGQLNSLSTLELNAEASHENMIYGKLADNVNAFFIDSGVGAHSMLTEIVAIKDKTLVKVGDDFDGVLMKGYPVYSRDMNQDGIIEVGGMYIPKGYEDAALAEIPFMYTYNDYKMDGSKETIAERYIEEGQHFYVDIPRELFGNVTPKRGENGVQLLNADTNSELFEVKWKSLGDLDTGSTVLGKTKDTVYYSDSISESSLSKEAFHFIEEE
jgi:hypothetical protein